MREIPSVFILPTQVAIHNTGSALSCMAFLKRQSNVTHQLCSQSLSFSHPLLFQEMRSKKDLFLCIGMFLQRSKELHNVCPMLSTGCLIVGEGELF